MLDHILKFMTLGTIIVGVTAIYTALHTNNRRLGADIFLRYSDRISDLRRRLPMAAFLEPGADGTVEMTLEERRIVHEAIYSIYELYELEVHGFIPPGIWKIREPDIERVLSLPVFRQELAVVHGRFASHPRFAAWLARIGQRKAWPLEAVLFAGEYMSHYDLRHLDVDRRMPQRATTCAPRAV
ncbi:hypothetical protein [Bradyrhizobium sp. USDA 3364]